MPFEVYKGSVPDSNEAAVITMGNLVPQQRVDRNGRLVTRHVKVDSTDDSKRRGFPPIINSKSIKLLELARIGRELDRLQPYATTISSYYRAVEEYPMMDDSTLEWLSSNIETVEQYSGTLRGRGRMGCSALEELVNGESPSLAAGQL